MKQKFGILVLIIFSLLHFGKLNAAEADIIGTWVNQAGDGYIEITAQNGVYSGSVTGGTGDKDRKDINNPDPTLRTRSLRGVKILGDMSYTNNDQWGGGWIYDPDNGKTYKCKMKLDNSNTLEITGYVGIEALGKTKTWKKKDK